MQILIPDSWLREYLDTSATVKDIQKALSLCSVSVERVHQINKDSIYDIEVTTNRVDLMSVTGIARETAAILPEFKHKAKYKSQSLPEITSKTKLDIEIINNPKLCPRIMAIKLSGVSNQPSPVWLQKRLEAVGQRPLNLLVDITNYVMWEIGHPIHVFDHDRLTTKKFIIREAKKGEQLITLDNKTYNLNGGETIIDNGKKEIIDLPGIMGTANSVVTSTTKNILVFIESNSPAQIRQTSMSLGLRSQAAVLNEKGVDPYLAKTAMLRAVQLYQELAHAEVSSQLFDLWPTPPKASPIKISLENINKILGITLTQKHVTDLLTRLDFKVTPSGVIPPTWRILDITIPEDITEEVARLYGYHNLPSQLMTGSLPKPADQSIFIWETRIKSALSHWGFTECYTYSLLSQDSGLKLKNPLTADLAYLRTSLAPSHLQVISENQGRVSEINLFEIANVFIPQKTGLPEEHPHLILSTTNLNILRLKGVVEALLSEMNVNISFSIITHPNALTCELNLTEMLPHATTLKPYVTISKFAPIIEDFNFTLAGPYADLEKKIYKTSQLITNVELVDKYNSKITLRITFLDTAKQLTSESIVELREKINLLK